MELLTWKPGALGIARKSWPRDTSQVAKRVQQTTLTARHTIVSVRNITPPRRRIGYHRT
jgi:hypothetical protein